LGTRTKSENKALTGARTMWDLVERRADASPDHPMLIAADGETVTFGQFHARAERAAAGLHDMGVTTGSVVSWQLPTRIDTVVLSIALSRLGAVQNPIIHLYREREVGFALRQTGASLFVVPGTWRDTDYRDLADRARSRKLNADDIAGGTFSITNDGPFGTYFTVPIINQPQVAILATDGIARRPVVMTQVDGSESIAIHSTGVLGVSWDHRAVDGAYVSLFLARVAELLGSRDWAAEL